MTTDELEIDILVGADCLWSFQKDCGIRDGGGEGGDGVSTNQLL